jgi:hypothetical protein
MNKSSVSAARGRSWMTCLGLALGLMILALSWHPMRLDIFLARAIMSPFETLFDPNGRHAAGLFWVGTLLVFLVLVGRVRHALQRTRHNRHGSTSRGHANSALADYMDARNWFV